MQLFPAWVEMSSSRLKLVVQVWGGLAAGDGKRSVPIQTGRRRDFQVDMNNAAELRKQLSFHSGPLSG